MPAAAKIWGVGAIFSPYPTPNHRLNHGGHEMITAGTLALIMLIIAYSLAEPPRKD